MRSRSLLLAFPLFLAPLGPAAVLNAQEPVQCPPAPSISGTVWDAMISLGNSKEVYEFLERGALAYTTRDGRFTGDSWKQNGECVTIDINDGYVKFTGRLADAKLSGEFVDRFGGKWTMTASRRWSGGNAGAGREWESLQSRYKSEYSQGRLANAVRTASEAVRAAERAFGPEDERLMLTLREFALMLQMNRQYADALPHAQRVLAIADLVSGKESRQYAEALNVVGKSYTGLQKYVEAEDVYRQALATGEKLYGPHDPLVALLLNNLGNLLAAQDRHDEAEPILERSLKLLDTDNADPNTLAPALNNLAVSKKELGKLDEAQMLYERCLGVMERQAGPEHKLLLPILKNLAILYKNKGWTDEAAETQARINRIQSRPE